jgi:hypothetical protein
MAVHKYKLIVNISDFRDVMPSTCNATWWHYIFQNISSHLPVMMVQHPKRPESSAML